MDMLTYGNLINSSMIHIVPNVKNIGEKMIIFDLDGCIADCEHRRHFVDPLAPRPGGEDYALSLYSPDHFYKYANGKRGFFYHKTNKRWQPDFQSYHEACDQDKPIEEVIITMMRHGRYDDVQIWSARSESVREKTVDWILKHIPWFAPRSWFEENLKMRPMGNDEPIEDLKKQWFNALLMDQVKKGCDCQVENHPIKFVFDSDPDSIEMWRRRKVFVFDCNQNKGF